MIKEIIDEKKLDMLNVENLVGIEICYEKLYTVLKYKDQPVRLEYETKKEMQSDLNYIEKLLDEKIKEKQLEFPNNELIYYQEAIKKNHKTMTRIILPIMYAVTSIAFCNIFSVILPVLLINLVPFSFMYGIENKDYKKRFKTLYASYTKSYRNSKEYEISKKPLLQTIKANSIDFKPALSNEKKIEELVLTVDERQKVKSIGSK